MKGFFIKASGLLMLGWLASVASAEGQLAASAVPANQPAPPEIKLNGLTTILGDKRALFKARPDYGEPASYFLAEGQSAGGIQLLAVDIRAGKIKVNNHGVVQVIVLCQPPDLSTVTAYPDTGASRIILTQTYGINSPDGLSPVLAPTMGTAGQNIFAGNPGGMAQAVNGGGSPGAGSFASSTPSMS